MRVCVLVLRMQLDSKRIISHASPVLVPALLFRLCLSFCARARAKVRGRGRERASFAQCCEATLSSLGGECARARLAGWRPLPFARPDQARSKATSQDGTLPDGPPHPHSDSAGGSHSPDEARARRTSKWRNSAQIACGGPFIPHRRGVRRPWSIQYPDSRSRLVQFDDRIGWQCAPGCVGDRRISRRPRIVRVESSRWVPCSQAKYPRLRLRPSPSRLQLLVDLCPCSHRDVCGLECNASCER